MSKYTDLVRQLYVCGRGRCTPENCERFNHEEEGELSCQDVLCAEAAEAMEELLAYEDLYRDLADEGKRAAMKFRDACPKWISVEERLPENSIGVLVTDGTDVSEGWLCTCSSKEGAKVVWGLGSNDDGPYGPITYWMPLPEPPAKEEK